jgi:hypothetical protein
VLAAVRDLNRVELLAETLRAALNEIAVATPDWLQPAQGRGPGDRVESPYDTDARFRTKGGTCWTGYMVHLTESCDAGAPRLVLHADTTPANVHEASRTAPIHDALAAKGLAPSEHLVDSAYVSAEHLIAARERHGIDLVGPGRRNLSWQSRDEGAFGAADFAMDWDGRAVRCPEGRVSAGWVERVGGPGRRGAIRIRFRATDCRGCPSRARCTRSRSGYSGRVLTLLPRREHEALAATRAREGTAEGRRLYAQRQGWRPRSRRACAPSACAGRAIAAWPGPACSTWPPPRPSTSTGSPPGSPGVRSRLPASHASPPSLPSGDFASGVRAFDAP